MRVLIVGAGIAGPTLAHWLRRTGHEVTLVDHAPAPREGGYLVDFWGAGFDVAERMGIVPRLMEQGYLVREMREVGSDGRRIASLDPSRLIDSAGGRYVTIARADLASAIAASMGDAVETIFGDTVSSFEDDGDRVRVRFAHGRVREFDLVIGADGLRSRMRRMLFGSDGKERLRDLGIAFAVFDVASYEPREELVAFSHTEVGFQVLRFALHDGGTMFVLTFRHEGPIPEDIGVQQDLLRTRFAGVEGKVPEILALMPQARTFYSDQAAQVLLPEWSRGRVALIGDAAAGPSLLAGQGSALAMIEAYVLAVELDRAGGDHICAFAAWQRTLAKPVRDKQDAAIGLGVAFAPRNRLQLAVRALVLKTMGLPIVERVAMGRILRDPIELPPPPHG